MPRRPSRSAWNRPATRPVPSLRIGTTQAGPTGRGANEGSGGMRLTQYRFGEFELDPSARELWRNGQRVPLPPKSFECLAYLIANRQRAVGRDELIAAVWGRVDVTDTVVAQTLLRARKALDDTGERQAYVRTVPRFGYQWVAPLQEASDVDAPGNVAVEAATAAQATIQRTTRVRPGWRAALIGGAVAALLLIAAGIGWTLRQPVSSLPTGPDRNLAVVLPVVIATPAAEDAWVRLGAMDYIASRLRRSGMKVLPSEQTLHVSSQLGDLVRLDETRWRQLKRSSAANWVIAPEASHGRDGWRVRLRLFDGDRESFIDAHGSTPLAAASAATDSWLRRLGRRINSEAGAPSPLAERLQQIDAELVAGQVAAVRRLISDAPSSQRRAPSLLVREAQLEFRVGRVDHAARVFTDLLSAQHAENVDEMTRALAWMGLGAVEIRRTDYPKAEANYTSALKLLESHAVAIDDPSLLGNAYNGRGVARVEQKKMEDAGRDMGSARIAMQRAGDLVDAAMVDANLGIIETRRGHYAQALKEFDRAIEVFERFQVRDYLTATLASKTATQLAMAQPEQALATATRAESLARAAEDAVLAGTVVRVLARAQLSSGRLHEARGSMERLGTLGMSPRTPLMRELAMRLELAAGRPARADVLARELPDDDDRVTDGLAMVAIQAATRQNDVSTARAWLAQIARRAGTPGSGAALPMALSWVARAEGEPDKAMASVDAAVVAAEREGSPDERVRAGVAKALLLLEGGHADAAAAVLGDLDAFVDTDYRVAWATWHLYRTLGDTTMAAKLLQQAVALKGERDLSSVPVL